ncbi:MoaD/ThiS family protein, partial [Chloroflexota bacterium]
EETIDSLLRKIGKRHGEFEKIAFNPGTDAGKLEGCSIPLNDRLIPASECDKTIVQNGDLVAFSLSFGC